MSNQRTEEGEITSSLTTITKWVKRVLRGYAVLVFVFVPVAFGPDLRRWTRSIWQKANRAIGRFPENIGGGGSRVPPAPRRIDTIDALRGML